MTEWLSIASLSPFSYCCDWYQNESYETCRLHCNFSYWQLSNTFSKLALCTQHLMRGTPSSELMLLECALKASFAGHLNFRWFLIMVMLVDSIWSTHENNTFVKGIKARVGKVFKYDLNLDSGMGLQMEKDIWIFSWIIEWKLNT